ncbi:MAG: hypothetical protein WCK11_04495 [Candidatus Falkowbacteria bacterium]
MPKEQVTSTKKRHAIGLAILALLFFLVTSSYNWLVQEGEYVKWSSPDETANYFLTKYYSKTGELYYYEPNNLIASEIIHPRSLRATGDLIKPMSFLGMILIYGKIAAIFGAAIIPYLTPFFAALGLLFFYGILHAIFDRRVAWLGTIILAAFPPYIYYTCHSMFHNVLFIVLTLAALYFFIKMNLRKTFSEDGWAHWRIIFVYPALGGVFLGLAIITRTSELLWLGPMLVVAWLCTVRRTGLVKLIVALAFIGFGLLPAAYHNQLLYDKFWASGYPEMNKSLVSLTTNSGQLLKQALPVGKSAPTVISPKPASLIALSTTNQIKQIAAIAAPSPLQKIRNAIFYFGFNPNLSVKMIFYYFVDMFPWLFWGAIFGVVLFVLRYKKLQQKQVIFLVSGVILSMILLLYYGSWKFNDNPNTSEHTIGNSYTRYWLPVYLFAIAWLAAGLTWFTKIISSKIMRQSTRYFMVLTLVIVELFFVATAKSEGLLESIIKADATRQEYYAVMHATETNAVIITQYHDKLFFPERRVIVGLFNDDNMNRAYGRLASRVPLYYYNFTFPTSTVRFLNTSRLAQYRVAIVPIKRVTKDFTLYRLESIISTNVK